MALTWYPKDTGRYARKTRHLSMLEHGAYNLLLDIYYSSGGLPQPSNAQAILKQCSKNAELMPDHSRIYRACSALTKHEQEAVDNVLEMFFYLDNEGCYKNEHCDQVIEEQDKKHETRVRVGRENREKALLKQCSSNAGQKKKKKKNIYPPTPQKGEAPTARGLDSDSGDFKIDRFLKDADYTAARHNAPGWDIQYLCRVYDDGINSGDRERPTRPPAAFVAWCKVYTKGKKP
jgi:uncharacterized protein YdaU (DUF1376 family)